MREYTLWLRNCKRCNNPLPNKTTRKYCSTKCRRGDYYIGIDRELTEAEKLVRSRLNGYRNRAARKGMEFNLSFKQVERLLSDPCDYCGQPAGTVDRKDNNTGYVFSNCVAACKRCNTVKSQYLTYDEMKKVADLLWGKG